MVRRVGSLDEDEEREVDEGMDILGFPSCKTFVKSFLCWDTGQQQDSMSRQQA